MTFLSIVIPVYNVQDYIHRCIDSLIKQSLFKQIEVLLVDDGSMDSSGKICDEYANKYENIRVYHKENGGLSHARNFAIEYLNSDYVFFLDSDDMVAGSFLSDMKRIIDGDRPDVICFKCCYERKKEEYRLKGNKKITVNDNRKILDDYITDL